MHKHIIFYCAYLLFLNCIELLNGQNINESQYNVNIDKKIHICNKCECLKINTTNNIEKLGIYCVNLLEDSGEITWPKNEENLKVDVLFENLQWTTIEKFSKNTNVESLRINNNMVRTIQPAAFSDLLHLKYLQLSGNLISDVTNDIFESLDELMELDLSNNKLSGFNELNLVYLQNLKSLNLANNFITKVPIDTLEKLSSLEILNLSRNQIYFLDLGGSSEKSTWLKKLKYLDLSFNKISTIYFKDTFKKANVLEYLNLSSNAIATIEENVFQDMNSLITLDLSNNVIAELPDLNPSLKCLYLQVNSLKKWPNLPDSILVLDLSRNNLYENYNQNYLSFDNLMFLNISKNILSDFKMSKPLPKLKILDISYNILPNIPQSLSSDNLPDLEELILDGNPMEKLKFSSEIELRRLSAKNLDNVQELDASGFSNLKVKVITSDNMDKHSLCIDIAISHCLNLNVIHENSFQGLKLCHLDISHNKLNVINENIAEWNDISGGVNIQGNPWNCTCDLQWVLDVILNDLYAQHPTYLHELRCATPRLLQGIRLVHWYDRKEKTFCVQNEYLSNYVLSRDAGESGVKLLMSGESSVVAILVAIFVALILCIGLIVYLIVGKHKHNKAVRRQIMRKRQTISDAQLINSNIRKQNEPFHV